jgi:uncharacterized damage-inducible protein DinB
VEKEPNMASELETFMRVWDEEAAKTVQLLRALPEGSYDFRPDASGRSVGELAWHLAEGDAYMSYGIEKRGFDMGAKPPGIERPKSIAELAPGYERIHQDAVARIQKLEPADLATKIRFFDGSEWTIGQVLWQAMVFHNIHHRGQLSLMCRLAGGSCPGLYGPNREEMAAMRAQMEAAVAPAS